MARQNRPIGQDNTLDAPAAKLLPRLQSLAIVDVDVHIHDSPGALAPHCEEPWRKLLEHLDTLPGHYLSIPQFAPFSNPWPNWPQGLASASRRSTVSTATQMRADLDDLGVRIGVLFPDNLLLHALLRGTDFPLAVARAYNRWLTSEWLGLHNGLKGVIIAPSHDPLVAAHEIMTYADHPDVVGVFLPTAAVDPLYGNRRYDPVYDAAQEARLPVFLHSVTALSPVFPFNIHGFETLFSAQFISHSFALMANLLSMIETGVPVRFPRLDIVFTEGGIAWVPWMMMKLDKEYAERRRELPFLTERPSHYIKRQMYFATQPIEEPDRLADVATIIELCECAERVIFASDWPHHDFDHPGKLLQLPVTEDVQRKIMSENAARLLRLDLSDGQ
jgi:predicted TIM-barrel fold metal-dependent hydrolase